MYKLTISFAKQQLIKLADQYASKKENSVPFYVSSEGALFAKAEEVIRTKVVQEQLEDFVRLQDFSADKQNGAHC